MTDNINGRNLTISVVIPAYNSAATLEECLKSIVSQNYPKDKIEIIIVDADSTDSTLDIAKKYNISKILTNKLKTGEAGKALGVKAATGEIVAFIDSDNILDRSDWIERMLEPFSDNEVVVAEPFWYSYRESDSYITRYSSLLGMNDPVCLFLGNYDRMSVLTGKWTEMPAKEEDRVSYLKITLDEKNLPTIGANGFLVRKEVISKCNIGDYLFDIDLLFEILNIGKKKNFPVKIAKVKIGIVHIFAGNIISFMKKQKRRIVDYNYFSSLNKDGLSLRKYPWRKLYNVKLMKFAIYTILVFPLVYQSIIGYSKKKDCAWFFHPVACWITLLIYSCFSIKNFFIKPKAIIRFI